MDRLKIARNVVGRRVISYEASGDFEKSVGYLSCSRLGVTDAPKEFFDEVRDRFEDKIDVDPEDHDSYDKLHSTIVDVADDMDLLG
jgi:tRNA A37 threonylcarbamoyladenosine synthetase subunit TsaC/SUA5/YrdC